MYSSTLHPKLTRYAKKIAKYDWEDLLSDMIIKLIEKDIPDSHLYLEMKNLYRPEIRKQQREKEVVKDRGQLDNDCLDNYIPYEIMATLFNTTEAGIKLFFHLRVECGYGIRRISKDTGIRERTCELIDDYYKDYLIHHADQLLRIVGVKPEGPKRRWNIPLDKTERAGNSIIQQYYVREAVDLDKYCRRCNINEELGREIISLLSSGLPNEEISEFAHKSVSQIERFRGIFNEFPLSIYMVPREPAHKYFKDSNNNVHGEVENATEFRKKKEKTFKCLDLDHLEDLLCNLMVPYSRSQRGDTAIETIIIKDRCSNCGNGDCIEVYDTNHKISWVCHSCRTKYYGGSKGHKVTMPEFYEDYPNTLKGLLLLLGAKQDVEPINMSFEPPVDDFECEDSGAPF